MFAKLVTIILVLGAMYGALLVNRQKRIDAASEMSRIHFQLQDLDQKRVRLQVEVARATTVKELESRLAKINIDDDLKSIPNRFDPENMKPATPVDEARTVAQSSRTPRKKVGGG